ncbi:uncharacterized protein TNCV_1129641 [Trichonephila clavipes]|nr:uncharacterized protein TNCV_1129641 [Trichonephila clavipes]
MEDNSFLGIKDMDPLQQNLTVDDPLSKNDEADNSSNSNDSFSKILLGKPSVNLFSDPSSSSVSENEICFDQSHLGNMEDNAMPNCQVIYSQFGLAIHQNDHQARRRFVELAQNEIAVVPYFHKRILFSDEAHFWLNGYVNKQNCRIWNEANPQVYVELPLHPEKLTVWCALWAGGILLQKR